MKTLKSEFRELLERKDTAAAVKAFDRAGKLVKLIPEIAAMKKSARRFYFHPEGLWQHAAETLASFEKIMKSPGRQFPGFAGPLRKHLSSTFEGGTVSRETLLKAVALIHDVAKPACAKRVGNRMRFLGHDTEGAKMAAKILKRLGFARGEIAAARVLVAEHMRPISLSQATVLTPRAVNRFFRDLGPEALDVLLLALSDWHSYKGLKTHRPAELRAQEKAVRRIVKAYFAERNRPQIPKLVDGNMIMKAFGLKPGPHVGALLTAVKKAQEQGKVSTPEEALALLKKKLTAAAKKR